jgi:hypothetical protein
VLSLFQIRFEDRKKATSSSKKMQLATSKASNLVREVQNSVQVVVKPLTVGRRDALLTVVVTNDVIRACSVKNFVAFVP